MEASPGPNDPQANLWARALAARDHTGTSFAAHLEGTAAVLRSWGQRPALVAAGRYHAVCGNPRGRGALCAPDAPELVDEIGAEAAALVGLWARVDRGSLVRALPDHAAGRDPLSLETPEGTPLALSRGQYVDLAFLYAANEVEVLSRHRKRCVKDAVWGLRPLLSDEAVARLEALRTPRPKSRIAWVRKRMRRLLSR